MSSLSPFSALSGIPLNLGRPDFTMSSNSVPLASSEAASKTCRHGRSVSPRIRYGTAEPIGKRSIRPPRTVLGLIVLVRSFLPTGILGRRGA